MFDLGMSPITVNVQELIRTVGMNRENHRQVFEEAVVKFREKAIERLDDLVKRVSDGKLVHLSIPLPVPEEHTDDYDRALRMLRMHQGPTIELTETSYRCLVDDEWGWRHAFLMNTASYTRERTDDLDVS